MIVFGMLIAIGAAAAFVIVAVLLLWGGWQTLRRELLRGFRSANTALAERALLLLLVGVPLAGAALLALLAAGRIALITLGLG